MLKIETISIEEFRGIRSLDIDFKAKNFAICGPNGSGKSGVIDAIEFCLTGDISKLSGPGARDLSVKQHGPHVDARQHPDRAKVILRAIVPELGTQFTIQRSIHSPRTPTLTPRTKETINALAQIEAHPEFVLSRRQIVKYVLTPAGNRARDFRFCFVWTNLSESGNRLRELRMT